MSDPNMIVHVDLGERSYDIVIGTGLITQTGQRIRETMGAVRALIVTDTHVADAHLGSLRASLNGVGIEAQPVIMQPGERSKSWDGVTKVSEAILDANLERNDVVIALGGGVIGDLAGFAASITRRGMRFVQIPTSLLAQVDSSVGGKTGINTRHGKNLVGAFHQPALVLADTDVLRTLPARQMRAGYAEIVKYALIGDPRFFDWLEANAHALLNGDEAALSYAIATSCEAKAKIVAEDERETGARALLNLGHTFGHALETLTNYDADTLVHGEGVAIGMALAHAYSQAQGLCPGQDVTRVLRHLENVGLPTHIGGALSDSIDANAIVEAMKQDKKVSRGEITLILTRGIGKSFIQKGVPEAQIHAFLKSATRQPATVS